MWGMNTQINGQRKSKKQSWEIGNEVKVGFLTLRVKSSNQSDNGYKLESLDGVKQYDFVPHNGLVRIN